MMTQNEILATLHKIVAENQQFTTWTVSTPHLVALVNQAVEQEREACAKLFDDRNTGTGFYEPHEPAEIIRARGETT
jgi:hypothetical protein